MPELPEVETVRLQLLRKVLGKTIASVEVFHAKTVAHDERVEDALIGKTIAHIDRIDDNLTEIFARSRREERPTGEVADAIAEERFKA